MNKAGIYPALLRYFFLLGFLGFDTFTGGRTRPLCANCAQSDFLLKTKRVDLITHLA